MGQDFAIDYEAGWAQELRAGLSLELNAYLHDGHNSFENHEISISKIFATINFHAAKSRGALNMSNNIYPIAKESDEIPIQYAPSRTPGGSMRFRF